MINKRLLMCSTPNKENPINLIDLLKVFDVNDLEMLRDLRRVLTWNTNYMTIITYMGDIVERIAVALDFGNPENV